MQLEAEVQEHCGTPAVDTWIFDPGNGILNEIQQMLLLLCSHGSLAAHVVAGNEFWKMVKSYVSLRKKFDGSSVDQLWGANNKVLNAMIIKLWQVMNSFTNVVFTIGVSLYWEVPSEETENYHILNKTTGSCLIEEMKKKQLSYELEFVIIFSLGWLSNIRWFLKGMERNLTLNNLTNMIAIVKATGV